jgi:hypothetical protein
MSMQSSSSIVLPPGWSIPTYRETSQSDITGRITQGILFSLQAPAGQVNSVFVPNQLLGQTAAIEAIFNARIAAIEAITG